MPYRWTNIRLVEPVTPYDNIVSQPFSLWWAALAAAEETMQGGPLVPSFLRLFTNHLSRSDKLSLRWGGDLAESAEMRRAYSALYGRYFSRALLASRLGLTDFVSLRTNITRLPNGVTVARISKGDIPDWIAWNPAANEYCLCEAKGSLTGDQSDFQLGQPKCISNGKKQFQRVEVRDSRGLKLTTQNWVAANLWATDNRPRDSVSLLWDPREDGHPIPEDEMALHADGIRRRRIASIALRLGRFGLLNSKRQVSGALVRILAEPDGDGMPTIANEANEDVMMRKIERPASKPHKDTYAAAAITSLGIRPIVSKEDIEALRVLKKRQVPTMIYGLSLRALRHGADRDQTWVSSGGIVSPDGSGLFDLNRVEIRT